MIFNDLITIYHNIFNIKNSICCILFVSSVFRNILVVRFNGWVKFEFNENLLNSETISNSGHLSAYIALNILLCCKLKLSVSY